MSHGPRLPGAPRASSTAKLSANAERRKRNIDAGDCPNQNLARTHERPQPGQRYCDACKAVRR